MATSFEDPSPLANEPTDEPVDDSVDGPIGDHNVIDLTTAIAKSTTVSVVREDNPLASMNETDRMRLFIRVLCELVAYGELDADTPTAAGL